MRVSLGFLVLSILGTLTYHLVEGGRDKNGPSLTRKGSFDRLRRSISSLGKSGKSFLSRSKSDGQKEFKRGNSVSDGGKSFGSTLSTTLKSFNMPEGMTPEQEAATCAQQLAQSLASMGLGNMATDPLNSGMVLGLENQLLRHFESNPPSDDFLMGTKQWRDATAGLRPKAASPRQKLPDAFEIDAGNSAAEDKTMSMQRRCSKRCMWHFGYILKPAERMDPQQEGTTDSGEVVIIPIVDGGYRKSNLWKSISSRFSKNKPSPHRCACVTTEAIESTIEELGGNVSTFKNYKRQDSEAAMKYLADVVRKSNSGYELMDHEAFTELVLFEILKWVREGEDRKVVAREIRAAVERANDNYRGMLSNGSTPRRVAEDAELQRSKTSEFLRSKSGFNSDGSSSSSSPGRSFRRRSSKG